jgi:hypothetical protein
VKSNRLAVLVLLAAITAISLFFWLKEEGSLERRQLMAYLPHQNGSLAYADVELLRQTRYLSKLLGERKPEADYLRFVQGTGFDFEKDLDDLAILIGNQSRVFAVAQGRFSWSKLRDYGLQQGGRCTDKDCVIATSNQRTVFYQFLRNGVIGISFSPAGSEPHQFSFGDLPNSADVGQGPIWLKSTGPDVMNGSWVPTVLRETLGISLSRAQRIMLSVEMKDLAPALLLQADFVSAQHSTDAQKDIQTLIQQIGGSGDRSNESKLLSGGKVQQNGNRVEASWSLKGVW